MTWVRFWCQSRSAAGPGDHLDRIEWFDPPPLGETYNDETMLDIAREYGESTWMRDNERGFDFGWEVLDPLPENVRQKMLRIAATLKAQAEEQINRLDPPPSPTAWARLASSPTLAEVRNMHLRFKSIWPKDCCKKATMVETNGKTTECCVPGCAWARFDIALAALEVEVEIRDEVNPDLV